jgi:hypothetical protein
MSGWAIRASTFSGFTEPPYWMQICWPASPKRTASRPRMNAWTCWAVSGVAVRPVPIAQTGS